MKKRIFNQYAAKFAGIFILLKIIIFFKEIFLLEKFATDNIYQNYLFIKPAFDGILLFSSSVFYIEHLYKDKKVALPFWQILTFIFVGILVTFFDKKIDSKYYSILILIISSALVSTLSNAVVVLSKGYGSSWINFIVNSSENYIILLVLVLFSGFSFYFIIYLGIILQLMFSIWAIYFINKSGFKLSLDFSFKFMQFNVIKILASSFLVIVLVLSRYFYDLDASIAGKNFSLLVASSGLLVFERYIEYAKSNSDQEESKTIKSYFYYLLAIAFFAGTLIVFSDVNLNSNYLSIILNAAKYFLLLLPIFLFFIFSRYKNSFQWVSILILLISIIISNFNFGIVRSDFFIIICSFLSGLYLIVNNERKAV